MKGASLGNMKCLVLLMAVAALAFGQTQSIALRTISDVPVTSIMNALKKTCTNVNFVNVAQSDYSFEVIKTQEKWGREMFSHTFSLTIFDHHGKTINIKAESAYDAVTAMCQVYGWDSKSATTIDVVDTSNLTQSVDARGSDGGLGLAGAIVNATTGRTTHTDSSWMKVKVNGENAWMDCYERHKGCSTIAPGHYFGKVKGGNIWLAFVMPVTHRLVRNHYKVVGSW
jgi:hypothetical protein